MKQTNTHSSVSHSENLQARVTSPTANADAARGRFVTKASSAKNQEKKRLFLHCKHILTEAWGGGKPFSSCTTSKIKIVKQYSAQDLPHKICWKFQTGEMLKYRDTTAIQIGKTLTYLQNSHPCVGEPVLLPGHSVNKITRKYRYMENTSIQSDALKVGPTTSFTSPRLLLLECVQP